MNEEEVKKVVKETIEELLRQDRIKDNTYLDAMQMITDYYKGAGTEKTEQAIKSLSSDPYFRIIPRYFRDGYTNEQLAMAFDCELSTIARNKRRLCLEIYRRAQ